MQNLMSRWWNIPFRLFERPSRLAVFLLFEGDIFLKLVLLPQFFFKAVLVFMLFGAAYEVSVSLPSGLLAIGGLAVRKLAITICLLSILPGLFPLHDQLILWNVEGSVLPLLRPLLVPFCGGRKMTHNKSFAFQGEEKYEKCTLPQMGRKEKKMNFAHFSQFEK